MPLYRRSERLAAEHRGGSAGCDRRPTGNRSLTRRSARLRPRPRWYHRLSEQFENELAEEAGPIHIPITANQALFQQAVALGRTCSGGTLGRTLRAARTDQTSPGRAKQITPVEGMPEKYDYDPATQRLTVGTGTFGPVSPRCLELSGLGLARGRLLARLSNEDPQGQEVE